jgi:hypothetical protein
MKTAYQKDKPEFSTRRRVTAEGTPGCDHRMECVCTGERDGTGMEFHCRRCPRAEVTEGYECRHEYVFLHSTGYSPAHLLSDHYECRLCGQAWRVGHGVALRGTTEVAVPEPDEE